MDKPLVTIIVLTYNKFNFFKECMDSILMQHYPKIDLIISDDGSDDFDMGFIKSYINENKKSNIINVNIIHHDKNMGTVKNYNNAIKLSRGKYIIGLAIDDCFHNSDVIGSIVKFFIETKASIITSYRDVYDEQFTRFVERLPQKREVEILNSNNNIYRILCKHSFISGACTYYSKEFFEKYGLFDECYKLTEDYPKYLQVERNQCKIRFLNKPTIKYRLGGISSSNKVNPLFKKDYETAILKEILPYKKDTGIFINRFRRFEYYRMTNKKTTYKLMLLFPDIVLYKIVFKLRNKTLFNFLL